MRSLSPELGHQRRRANENWPISTPFSFDFSQEDGGWCSRASARRSGPRQRFSGKGGNNHVGT
jgi:hypothetical protein